MMWTSASWNNTFLYGYGHNNAAIQSSSAWWHLGSPSLIFQFDIVNTLFMRNLCCVEYSFNKSCDYCPLPTLVVKPNLEALRETHIVNRSC